MMAQIVAVGNRSFAAALAGVGAEPRECADAAAFREALKKLAMEKDVRIVFAPEELIAEAHEAIHYFRSRSDAALLGLPLRPTGEHVSLQEMRYLVEQATGASLI